MPKIHLTQGFVSNPPTVRAKVDYFDSDIPGFILEVRSTGKSTYYQRYRYKYGRLKQGQNWRQEIVAKLSASALCQMIGKEDKYLGGSYAYIEHYAWQAKLSPYRACRDNSFKTSTIMEIFHLLLKYIHYSELDTKIQEIYDFIETLPDEDKANECLT